MTTLPIRSLTILLALAILLVSAPARKLYALSGASTLFSAARLAPAIEPVRAEGDTVLPTVASTEAPSVALDAPASRRLMPTVGGSLPGEIHTAAYTYDPTSAYDQKGASAPRGFSAQAPAEMIDPFSGNLILQHTDLTLPGVAGLDLILQRVYNSKIHRNYAARVTGDLTRVQNGMLFVPPSPLGLGWNLHLGRIVGGVNDGPNEALAGPRYYEAADGSQSPFFTYSGADCGNGTTDVCLTTKNFDNPYQLVTGGPWYIATANGLNITFGHATTDGATVVHYATEIRDVHGNRIQITYHTDTIPGIGVQRDYFRHFINTIVDSAGRVINFGYTVVSASDVVRLTSITAVGRTYTYDYTPTTPYGPIYAFLTRAEPPEGAPWRYEYAGLDNGDCADNSKRWCELTQLTYPAGGTVTYSYDDLIFWAQTNPASVRAVSERVIGGREIDAATWTYDYNRAADYSGTEHTIITRPDNSQELYTYFGVGNGTYNPFGQAWKAGILLQKRVRDGGNILQTESFEWVAGPAISGENWGDPWIGFDAGVFQPRLQEHTLQRGNLSWTTTYSSYNENNNTPRCTTETGDGPSGIRYRLNTYEYISAQQGDYLFTWMNLPEVTGLSYTPFTAAQCNPAQTDSWTPDIEDELTFQEYTTEGQISSRQSNGVIVDYQYLTDGSRSAEITYQGENRSNGYCTAYSNFQYGIERTTTFGASAPGCNNGLYTETRLLYPDGSTQQQTNGEGVSTDFEYDDLGRVVRIEPVGQAEIVIIYDGSANSFNTERRVEQGSYWVENRFDGFGRGLGQESSAGIHTRQSHDALNRLTFQSLPSGSANSTVGDTFTYDALGRAESVTHADGSTVAYAYDLNQHRVTITDEENRQTVQTRRSFSSPDSYWLVRVQLPGETAPTVDTYTYLVGGHLTGIDYGGRQRILQHNFAKEVIYEYSPESGNLYYGYDAGGNLRCRSLVASACHDGNLNSPTAQLLYTIDALGRVTALTYIDGKTTTLTYDDANNVERMTDEVGSHEFDYSPTNQLEERRSTIQGVTYTTGYSYDNLGNLETMTYPSGRVVTYGRDAGNRIKSVRDAGGFYVTNMEYHPNGMASSITYANGVATTLSLDDNQRPDLLQAPGVLNLNYDFGAAGNLESLSDGITPNNSTTFSYDDLNRLTDANGAWGTLHYEYNASGDRTLERLDGEETTYTYSSQGLLQSLSGRVNLGYGYDQFGNVTQRGTYGYSYDAANRLATVTGADNITFAYDGHGQRMVTTNASCAGSVIYTYDQKGNRIAESTAAGLVLKEYIVADGRTIAALDMRPLRADVAEIDFGGVEIGTTETRTIELTNRSSTALTLNNLQIQGGSFSLQASLPLEIPANGNVSLTVRFAPFQRQSFQGKVTTCESNGATLDVALRGRGLAAVAVLTLPEYDLGDVPLGERVERTLVVSNTGDAPLRLVNWSASDAALTITPSGAATIQPNTAQSFTIAFDSVLTKCDGPYRGLLELESNSITPAVVSVRAVVRGLEVVAGDLNFGPLNQGESHTLNATLINRATIPMTPTLVLMGAPQFQLGSVPSALVAPGATVDVAVSYRPTPVLWSPFGDHATLVSARPGCEASCPARVHLIGNIGAEVVPGGGIQPTLAATSDGTQVASIGNGIAYAVRDGSGAWSPGTDPSGGAAGVSQPSLLAAPDGTLTMLWHESGTPDQLHLKQRTGNGAWGALCTQAGTRRSGMPLALDSAGNVWLAWTESATNDTYAAPIFSAADVCQAGQMPVTAQLGRMSDIDLVNGADGLLRIAAGSLDHALDLGTLDPTSGAVDLTYNFAASVNPNTAPDQAIGPDGRWHVAWSGDSEFYDFLDLEGEDQALYAYAHANTRFVEVVPLMRESSQADGMQIAADSLGDVHIAWSDLACAPSGQRKLYYVRGRPTIFAGGWQAIDVTPPGYTGADPTLAMVVYDDVLMAAWENNAELLFGEAGVGSRAATNVVSATITPDQGGSLVVADGSVEVQFPPGAVTGETVVTYTRRPQPVPGLGNLLFAGQSFALEARDANNMPVSTFDQPYTIILRYSEDDWQQSVGDENSLNLYYWDGTVWKGVLPCAGCSLDTTNNVLTALLNHMTEFALLGGSSEQQIYLPRVADQ